MSFFKTHGIPSTKAPINLSTFISFIVPPVVCYIVFAVLAITPQTRSVRIALWPVVALLAFRAVVSVNMSPGRPELVFLNTDLMLCMLSIAIHTLSWTLAKKPLVRYLRIANCSPSVIMDALDLATNYRGHGWDWSNGLYIPRDTRPTNRYAFASYALLSGVVHAFISGTVYRAVHSVATNTGSEVFTIFDGTLPFFVRYLRSSIISTLAAFGIYAIIQLSYDILTVLGILVFRQDPAQWPPIFDSPWFATSLNDFWGRRWHQFMRHMFLLGAYPLSLVFGRAGRVIGAFLASALFHHLTLITFSSKSDIWSMLLGFGMMGPGILAERMFYKLTGRRVGGVVGWFWTMAWLILWGNVIVDEFARSGMFLSTSVIDGNVPLRGFVENFVVNFDAWLHTI